MTEKLRNNLCLEPPASRFSGESRYLTTLWVSENGEPRDEEEQQVSSSVDSTISRFEPAAENIVLHNRKIAGTIKSALKRLCFCEQRVLVQFWSPHVIGKHLILTTIDQPFGLGVNDDQGLISYRKYSERNPFLVDKDDQEEDHSPPARVFRRGLPEWTSDILTNYNSKHFPLQDFTIRCKFHGYLALPVFDSTTQLCVGVLELLMSSKHMSFAYEVQQFHRVLKSSDLRTPQAFDCPTFNVSNEHKQIESEKIFSILEDVCRLQRLPLAQTWMVSPTNSFVSHEKTLTKSCNSFDTTCLGKVCMSKVALPFYIQDLGMWSFWKACRERHLDKSQGVVGRALSSRGTSFCEDVTKLSEEEYPLVHNARMSGLTSCFAIFWRSVESNNEYVLEFFLQLDMRDGISNVVQTLKQKIEAASIFVLGDTSSIQVLGPAREVGNQSLSIDPHDNPIFSTASDTITDPVGENRRLRQGRKRKMATLTVEAVVQHHGETIDQAAKSLKVSRSTLMRFCRKHKMSSWPLPKYNKKADHATNLPMPQISWSRSSEIRFSISILAFLLIKVKRWSCLSQRHGFSSKWWSCGKHRLLPCKSDSIYKTTCLIVYWKRWRNKILIRHAMQNKNQTAVRESTSKLEYISVISPRLHADLQLTESSHVHASPKKTNVSDTRMVTVKATFKDDMIKFPFPASSGLMELEKEVAQRFKLKSTTFRLKYQDEDNDLILLACDADLRTLIGFSTSKSTIKLIILAND